MSETPEYIHSEKPAIDLFQTLGYTYLNGADIKERKDITEVVLKVRLKDAIKRINPWLNDDNLNKVYDEISTFSGDSLMEINENIWKLLKGKSFTVKQIFGEEEEFRPVSFIDYENVDNNEFLVVNQIKYHGRLQGSIPDIVVYVNGLPLAVIECKSPLATNAWDKAYSDLEYYQKYSEKLFYYNQICLGLWGDSGRYGAICASQKFYSVFKIKDASSLPEYVRTEQDKLIFSLFSKENFLDIIRNFVIFELEEGKVIKKLPRYQQLRSTNKIIARLKEDRGGVVWHTQGSGKSITMAYVTRKLQAEENGFENPTVIVMTDRIDLDRQIFNTFRAVGFKNVSQAACVSHLEALLRNDYGGVICTTLQKFQENDKDSKSSRDITKLEEYDSIRVEKSIKDGVLTKITKSCLAGKWVETEREDIVLEELSSKKNVYVLVDEAHRSQYGFLASFMRTVLPHAKFVAFTGTPISKDDKSTLGEFYGGEYIDVYTIKESVDDGSTLMLLYDEGIARLDVKKEELDKEFEEKFADCSDEKKDKLKSEAIRKYQFSDNRIKDIAKHLVDNYRDKIYKNGNKAMIVCAGRAAAIKYKMALECLRDEKYHDFESKVVVSIGSAKSDYIAREYYETLEWNRLHPDNKKPVWVVAPEDIKSVSDDFKLPLGDESEMDNSGCKKFDNTSFLIVSDMLLTGYDVPIASCLYLDKPLKEHNLLQAIARVNRIGKGKEAGYIMDYNGITSYLTEALEIFSGDMKVTDVLRNINEEIPRLESNHAKLIDFFRSINKYKLYQRDIYVEKAILFIEQIDKRDVFKDLLKHFNKSISIVLPHESALRFQSDFKLFNEIKLRARNAYPDDDGLKISRDESKMVQDLIDKHIISEGVENLLEEPIPITDRKNFELGLKGASLAIKELKKKNSLKYTIKVGMDKNPDFYKPLAQRLEELLKQRREERISQLDLLSEFDKLQTTIIENSNEGESKGFVTERQKVVYDSMKTIFNGEAEDATNKIFSLIEGDLDIIAWETKGRVRKDIENKLKGFLINSVEKDLAKKKAKELVNLMVKNKDE